MSFPVAPKKHTRRKPGQKSHRPAQTSGFPRGSNLPRTRARTSRLKPEAEYRPHRRPTDRQNRVLRRRERPGTDAQRRVSTGGPPEPAEKGWAPPRDSAKEM